MPTMKYSRHNPHAAATAIQAAYRGYLVRRTKPLKHLRVIRNVRLELQKLESQLATDPRLFDSLRRDPQERLKWSEGGMALLLQLDSMQGVHPVVRDNRKSLTKEVISYQEYIDSAGKGFPSGGEEGRVGPGQQGPHVAYVNVGRPTGEQPLPYDPTLPPYTQPLGQGYGGPRVQQGPQAQGHVPYVASGPANSQPPLHAPPGQAAPPGQYPAPQEKPYPSAQGHSPYGYDIRFPPGTEADIIDLFRRADIDGSGTIDTKELSRILSLKFCNFSRRTVRLIIHLFADNNTVASRVGPAGFVKLWRELKKWQRVFKSFDNDNSGTIDLPELREAMLSLGIGVTPQVLQLLVFNYDRTGRNSSIAFGDFIECGLIVKGLTEKFIAHDPQYTGAAKIDYQAFMMMVLPFIVA